MFLKLYDLIDNRLSPTLVREIRQLVRNRFIVVMLNLYLLVLAVVTLIVITSSSVVGQMVGVGAGLYSFQMGFFFFFTFVVVNLYMAVIMSQERISNDLMFTTIIRPSGFVFGKLMSGIVLSFLLFCATLPFFTISYMLRGLDLRIIFDSSFYCSLVLVFSMALTILVFSRIKTYVQMIGIMFLYAWLCMMGVGGLMNLFVFSAFARITGVPGVSLFLTANTYFWGAFIVISTMCVVLSGAICRMAPTNTNRIMPFRLVYTIYMLTTLILAFVFDTWPGSTTEILPFFLCVHYAFFLLFIVITACGREIWGLRLKRVIPKNFLLRVIVFPFYSGAINGFVWLIGIGAILVSFCLFAKGATRWFDSEASSYFITWAVMIYAFSTIAMIIRSRFLKRFFPAENNWLLALAIFGAFYAVYFMFRVLLYYNTASYNNFFFDYDTIGRTMLVAMGWGILATAMLIPWALRRIPHFSPNVSEDELTIEKAKEIVSRMSFELKK